MGLKEQILQGLDRLPRESSKAYQAWCVYRDLGIERSIKSVAAQCDKSEQIIGRWSSEFDWVERAAKFDAAQDQIRLLAQVEVIEKAEKKRMQSLELTETRLLEELAKVGFSDLTKAAKWDKDGVEIFDSESLDPSVSGAISEVSISYDKQGNPRTKIKMHDKLDALQKLGARFGWLQEKSEAANVQNNYIVLIDSLKGLASHLNGLERGKYPAPRRDDGRLPNLPAYKKEEDE